MALTKADKRLREEVEKIAATVRMDVWNIERYRQPPFNRKALLQIMMDKLVRSHVILKYTYIDELLTDIICNRFGRSHASVVLRTRATSSGIDGTLRTVPMGAGMAGMVSIAGYWSPYGAPGRGRYWLRHGH
jgi:hypothetical protein